MKITIVSLNFFPEDTAIGLYSSQMANYLAEKYRVEVITAYPYYPKWEIADEYKNKRGYIKEQLDNGIIIHRHKQYVSSNVSFKNRVKLMLTFFYGAIKSIPKVNKPDVVIAVIPFTLSALIGVFLKWRYGSKLVIHIQDFEFDAAIQSGIIKNSFLQTLLLSFESWVLKRADVASTISKAMVYKLGKMHKNPVLFPNWISQSLLNYQHNQEDQVFDQNEFTVLYSGNIGEKQDWALFLEVIKALLPKKNIIFRVYGNGAKKSWLEAETKPYKNVVLEDFVPFQYLPKLLFSADLHLLIQKNDILDTVLPSKLLGMMASAKPSLVVGHADSEIKTIFEEIGNNYLTTTDNERIAQEIVSLANARGKRRIMGINARQYVEKNFSESQVLQKFETEILNDA